jgi:TRAP-type C4-dicarboxylate transport system substrate-binding protein
MTKKNYYPRVVVCTVLALMIVIGTMAPAQAAKYNWKLASVLPDTHPVHKALVIFADKVKEKTKG